MNSEQTLSRINWRIGESDVGGLGLWSNHRSIEWYTETVDLLNGLFPDLEFWIEYSEAPDGQ